MRALRGFTLIEVVVALALGAVLVASAHGVLVSLDDASERLINIADSTAVDANADILARTLVRSVTTDITDSDIVVGNSSLVTFVSWCDMPGGWLERCRVDLRLERQGFSWSARMRTTSGLSFKLPWKDLAGRLTYLKQIGDSRDWLTEWGPAPAAPAAIGVIRARDTLLLVVGAR
jgi:prepilin-type N-terminal cleavage/methylation domain-containing protein